MGDNSKSRDRAWQNNGISFSGTALFFPEQKPKCSKNPKIALDLVSGNR
jgi:hypothetical protein